MRSLLTILLLFTIFSFAKSQNSSNTLHKVLVIDNSILIIDGHSKYNIEIRKTKGVRLIVETTVKITQPYSILDALTKVGRYDDIFEIKDNNDGTANFEFNPRLNVVIVKGEEAIEEFNVILFVPETIEVVNRLDIK